jgi:hypothetical protein
MYVISSNDPNSFRKKYRALLSTNPVDFCLRPVLKEIKLTRSTMQVRAKLSYDAIGNKDEHLNGVLSSSSS